MRSEEFLPGYSYKTMQTKIGPLTLYSVDEKLVKIAFAGGVDERSIKLLSRYFGDLKAKETSSVLGEAEKQIIEFLSGLRKNFDLPLDLRCTEFQRGVYKFLPTIPYGETRSYADVAAAIGNSKACRAVGGANNKNPLPIVIPCHRVNAKSGELVGYAGGIEIKRILQGIEASIL